MPGSPFFVGLRMFINKHGQKDWEIGVYPREYLKEQYWDWFAWVNPGTGKINPRKGDDRWMRKVDWFMSIGLDVLAKVWVEVELPDPPKIEVKVTEPSVELPKLDLSAPKTEVKVTAPSVELPKLDLSAPKPEAPVVLPGPGVLAEQTILVYRMEGRVSVNRKLDTVVGLYDVSVCGYQMTSVVYVSGNQQIVPEAYTQIGYNP